MAESIRAADRNRDGTRPIETVVETQNQRIHVGADADWSQHEVIVLAAEIVEVEFDLAREILGQAVLEPTAGGKARAISADGLGTGHKAGGGQIILGVTDMYPGAAGFAVKQPVVGGVAEARRCNGKP